MMAPLPMTISPELSIQDLSYKYNQREQHSVLFDNFTLRITISNTVAIAGRSGIGKSTLLQLIAGLQKPQRGVISLGGRTSYTTSYLTQEPSLYPWFTVLQNIALPLKIKGHAKSYAEERARTLLRDFLLDHIQDLYPSQLSGGMKQRVSLLRSCAQESDLVLLDEPFSHLDAITAQECRDWFLVFVKQTRARVIIVTHNLYEAKEIASHIVCLHQSPVRADICDSSARIKELMYYI